MITLIRYQWNCKLVSSNKTDLVNIPYTVFRIIFNANYIFLKYVYLLFQIYFYTIFLVCFGRTLMKIVLPKFKILFKIELLKHTSNVSSIIIYFLYNIFIIKI